ncbi:MAG: AAA family ATPase, partial [Anaerolineales bacterium]|nr:AAA family ATPase [Anaerolineales bacterium]
MAIPPADACRRRLSYNGVVAESLLQTKLHIPVTRGQLVVRPRLLAQLAGGLTGRLTLLSAPAGFGKTTLVAAWARGLKAQAGPALAWLSLDEADNELGRFCRYLCAALAQVDASLALDVPPTLAPTSSQPLLTALLNLLAAYGHDLILALDDYHLVDNPAVHDCLLFLLAHAPANCHLLLLSRADPPFSLARLRGSGQVTEIRQQDLRFIAAESEQFLNQLMQLGLPAAAVNDLSERTEGWVAGLQMAAISLQGHDDPAGFIAGFSGSHRYIFDYLAEEVLARRPAGSRDFLLHTAILDRLSAPLCAALLGHADSDEAARTLAQLEAANLFLVPLDEERRWYRYHQLFANLLRQHLRREQPERVAGLHQVASEWFARAGYRDEAIEHALAGELFAEAAALVATASSELVIQGEISKLLGWIGRLPAEMLSRHPQLILNHA